MLNNSCKTVLPNGVRIITESLPVRTVSVGIWVNTGSRDEDSLTHGCSHFVEHMLFKGTKNLNARRIARELDSLGGASNAFTSKETTCLYATVLDAQLPRLISLYSDLFLNSEFNQQEVTRERSVILQEIDMVEDNPDELVHEHFSSCIWAGHPLGSTVLGGREDVSSISSEKLNEYVQQNYIPEKIVISAAGNVDHDKFLEMLADSFSKLNGGQSSNAKHDPITRKPPAQQLLFRKIYKRSLEQAHVVLGTYGLSANSPQRYAMALLNILLGGNMSSRLFQEVREKMGLAYSIYSFTDANVDSGQVGIGTGVNPSNVGAAISVIEGIVNEFAQGAVEPKELNRAKEFAKANLYLAAENMDARMMRLAKNEMIFNRQISFDEVDEAVDGVSCEAVKQLAAELFAKPLSGVVLGSVPEDFDFGLE